MCWHFSSRSALPIKYDFRLLNPGNGRKSFGPHSLLHSLLVVWHFSVIWTGTAVFPSPFEVARGLAELIRKNVLWRDIEDSLRRVAMGFWRCSSPGNSDWFDAWMVSGSESGCEPGAPNTPPDQSHRMDSCLAIILFGVGDRAAVFLIFLCAFFPIVVACVNGVSSVPLMFPSRRAQLWHSRRHNFLPRLSSQQFFRRSLSVRALHSVSHGWWLWQPR